MGKKRRLHPQSAFDELALKDAFEEHDIKDVHIRAVQSHLCKNFGAQFSDIPGLPRAAYTLLNKDFAVMTTKLVEKTTSSDGSTTKLLVELQDGQQVETVIIRHLDPLDQTVSRVTLCVSSQVGCQMGCTFCATGTMGLLGHLTAGEICEQVVYALQEAPITNVVFMGMGEPLHNYRAVLCAAKTMADAKRFGLAPSRITVSTVGVVPKMKEFTEDAPEICLALSLHAPTQEKRLEIVPSGQNWELEEIMDALDHHIEVTGRRVLIEYVLLDGVNDSDEMGHLLGNLLKDRNVHVNLIPYNPTDVIENYRPPPIERSRAFMAIVISYGILTTIRVEHGQDVAAACGQLAVKNQKDTGVVPAHVTGDIEDLGVRRRGGARGKGAAKDDAVRRRKGQGLPSARRPWPSATVVLAAACVAVVAALYLLS